MTVITLYCIDFPYLISTLAVSLTLSLSSSHVSVFCPPYLFIPMFFFMFCPCLPSLSCVPMFVYPRPGVKLVCPCLNLGVSASYCFILSIPHLMYIVFSFASLFCYVLICP